MRSLRWWLVPKAFIKPVSDCALFHEDYITLPATPFQSLRDDWRRYGWRVACYNLGALVRLWLEI